MFLFEGITGPISEAHCWVSALLFNRHVAPLNLQRQSVDTTPPPCCGNANSLERMGNAHPSHQHGFKPQQRR